MSPNSFNHKQLQNWRKGRKLRTHWRKFRGLAQPRAHPRELNDIILLEGEQRKGYALNLLQVGRRPGAGTWSALQSKRNVVICDRSCAVTSFQQIDALSCYAFTACADPPRLLSTETFFQLFPNLRLFSSSFKIFYGIACGTSLCQCPAGKKNEKNYNKRNRTGDCCR